MPGSRFTAPGIVMSGGDVDTLADIDAALADAHAVAVEDRGAGWDAWVAGLMARRERVVGPAWVQRETAVIRPAETR